MMPTLKRCLIASVLITLVGLICVAQKPDLVMQTGHSAAVRSLAFSPDGKTLVTNGGYDNTTKLWDVSTGVELRTLINPSGSGPVTFSPDGKTLACVGYNTIKLWDVSTGAGLRTLTGDTDPIDSVVFSPDGKILAGVSGKRYKTVRFWDVATGTQLRTLKGDPKLIRSVAFSADWKILASGSEDHTVKLSEVSTGRELRILIGHTNDVDSVAFSPDGRTVASGSWDHTVKLWDVLTGTELRTLARQGYQVDSVAFGPDGKTLATVRGSWDETVELWDVVTGTELHTFIVHPSGSLNSIAFSPDWRILASGNEDGTVKFWEVSTGRELRTLKRHSNFVGAVAFSPDMKTLASGSGDTTIKLWDIPTGMTFRTLKGNPDAITRSIVFSPDGKTLACVASNAIKLWDVLAGTELRTLTGHSGSVNSVAFSPNGKTLASGSFDRTIKLWDVATGTELRTFAGHTGEETIYHGDRDVLSVAFSPDGSTLASGSWDSTVKLWDVASGTELRTLTGHSGGVESVAFNPNGKTLGSSSADKTVKLWDVSSGTELRTLTGHSGTVDSFAFSPDGRTLASGSSDNTIKLWDASTGKELRTLSGHSNWISSVSFTLDNKHLISGSRDTTIRVWEVTSGKELASLIALDENDWAVVTPSGLFDGSPNAWKQLIWRLDNNTFHWVPVEVFFNDLYYPGLFGEIMAGKQPKPPNKDLSAIDIRQPQLRITSVGGQAVIPNAPDQLATVANTVGDRRVEMTLEITDNVKVRSRPTHPKTSGARDVRLFRNGSLVRLWPGDTFGKDSRCSQVSAQEPLAPRRVCTVTVPIVAGENRLTAYAFNHDNIKSTDATLTITGADSLKRKAVAYVLAVGVNEYANTQYNLKYAVADAQDFAAELKHQQAKLNNYERVEVIALNDKDATKANILKSLTDLSGKIQPEDALVIFFAGHGTAQQNRFYLIPHDLGYMGSRTQLDGAALQNILAHSISDEEISRAVEGIDAGQMLLVIDACNSGQALEAEEKRRGPMNSKGLAQLAYEKGMYILTAAQSYQDAQEDKSLGHGFLTYALVEEGLKQGAADREPKDGQVLLREWLDYATERVPQMQQEELQKQRKQGRQLDRIKFAETDLGNERSIQRPRVFYRRETEPHPLVVARP